MIQRWDVRNNEFYKSDTGTVVFFSEVAELIRQNAELETDLAYWKNIASERVSVNVENATLRAENERLRLALGR